MGMLLGHDNSGGNGNGNTNEHRLEAQIKELSARLDGLNAEMKVKFDAVTSLGTERDKRYEQRFATSDTAVAAALAAQQLAVAQALSAQKEATAAAFAASEKAIVKAEAAQIDVNERNNQLRGALDDSTKDKIPRIEADSRFKALDSRIEDMKVTREIINKEFRESLANLRESRSSNEGERGKGVSDRSLLFAVLGVLFALVAIVEFIARFLVGK